MFDHYNGPRINYSEDVISGAIQITPHHLLFQDRLKEINPGTINVNDNKALFPSNGDYPFDILAASFYLISRYEEYVSHKKDKYGRYAYENSIAYNKGFLHLPLVNIWINDLGKFIQSKFSSFQFKKQPFKFQPTYDIDIAYSYLNKGFLRNSGGLIRSLLTGDMHRSTERINVLRGNKKDPFDTYEVMDGLNTEFKLDPIYFFIVASSTGKYDKNISPSNVSMRELICHHARKYKVGIHPSWQSGDDPSLLIKEIKTLEEITETNISISRQHFIRFDLPSTYQNLIKAGITSDYSMGYGSINGFRASVATPFYWYDLSTETQTTLEIHPFCYMDANSFFEQKFTPHQALEEMIIYKNTIKESGGTMITIWHNPFLGTDKLFEGWKEVWETFLKEISSG